MLGVDLNTPLTDEERDSLIDSLAKKVADRRMETPAVLFLEMYKPLSFVASQGPWSQCRWSPRFSEHKPRLILANSCKIVRTSNG